MTDAEKLATVKTLLGDGGDVPSDADLTVYLTLAKQEIILWRFHLVGGPPEDMTDVPAQYELTQIYSVVAGYTHAGAEGQSVQIENGVHRHFLYSDMLDYIHNKVTPYARVGAVTT